MSNIAIITHSPDLTPVEKQSLEAWAKPKIKDVAKADMVDRLMDAVGKGYLNIGQAADKNKEASALLQQQMVKTLINELKDCFSAYSVEEICIAIDMGTKGKLIDLTELTQPIMSVANILKMFLLYRDKVRREAIHKQKQFEEVQEKKAEEAARFEKVREFEGKILSVYESFPKGFKTQNKGYLAAMYRHLDKKGLIELTIEAKKEIFNRVLKIKDRTKYAPKGLLEITAKELSEYRALYRVFDEWKFEDVNLKEKL